jgi:hypothetical protein
MYTTLGNSARICGSALSTCSMPLLGESRPKVSRTTPFDAELVLVVIRVDERDVRDAVRDEVQLGRRGW